MEQQFSLSWKNFHGNLSNGFADLLGSGEFVDVTLACDGQLLQAHKVVLSICSPYFKRMFQLNPCQHPIVVLRDISHRAMRDLIHFMYNGEVSVRQEDLAGFITTAETLQIKGLTNKHNGEGVEEVPKDLSPVSTVNNNVPESNTESIDLFSDDLSHQLENTHNQMEILNSLRLAALKRKSEEFIANNFNINSVDKEQPEKKIKLREKQILNRHKITNNYPRGTISVRNFETKQPRNETMVPNANVFNESRNMFVKKSERSNSYNDIRKTTDSQESNGRHTADVVSDIKRENDENDSLCDEPAGRNLNEMAVEKQLFLPMSPRLEQDDGATVIEMPTFLRASWPITQQNRKPSSSPANLSTNIQTAAHKSPPCLPRNGHLVSGKFIPTVNGQASVNIPIASYPAIQPSSQHTIVTIPQKEDGKKKYPQRSCRFCWRKSGKRRDTRFMCQQCCVPLCKTNCFEQHQTEGFLMVCKEDSTAVL